jgi:hypothetical protein
MERTVNERWVVRSRGLVGDARVTSITIILDTFGFFLFGGGIETGRLGFWG